MSAKKAQGPELAVEYVPTAELHTYYRNPRQGDPTAIARSLAVNGQYRPIVVNRGTHTGRPAEVLAGNHTLIAARDLGWEHIAVVWVDKDEDGAARVVAADNRTADLGSYDERLLAELLTDLPDLDGTGYDPGDLDALVALLDDEDHERDDQDVLDATDRDGWPQIKCNVPPEVHAQWLAIEGHDDEERVRNVLALVAEAAEAA